MSPAIWLLAQYRKWEGDDHDLGWLEQADRYAADPATAGAFLAGAVGMLRLLLEQAGLPRSEVNRLMGARIDAAYKVYVAPGRDPGREGGD